MLGLFLCAATIAGALFLMAALAPRGHRQSLENPGVQLQLLTSS